MRVAVSALGRVGDYQLEHKLGTGGMAEVFVARRDGPQGFSKRVALKRILPQLASDPRIVAMFCDEARIQAALSHPNLVQVFDFGEHEGLPYMVLEHVDGLTVAQLIARMAARRRPVALGPALFIAGQVLDALAYVHAAHDDAYQPLGIVHRDVAPSNILIGKMGQVKLGDFGILRSTAIDSRTFPGELKGKVGYASPEQALGLPVDHRSDLFSLGVVLSEMLLGGSLFPGRTELEVLEAEQRGDVRRLFTDAVPADLRTVLLRALSRWPERRQSSAAELSRALTEIGRAHGETLDEQALMEWLADEGLVPLQSDVRQRRAPSREQIEKLIALAVPHSEQPFREAVTLAAEEVDEPNASYSEPFVLLLAEPERDSVPPEIAHAVSKPGPKPPSRR